MSRPSRDPLQDFGLDGQLVAKAPSVTLVLMRADRAEEIGRGVVAGFGEQDLARLDIGPPDQAALVVFPSDFCAVGGDGARPAIVVQEFAIDQGAVEVEQDGLDIWGAQFLV